MPQSPTECIRRWLPLTLTMDISVSIVQRVLKYLLHMSQSMTISPSVIYSWKYKQNKSIRKVFAGNFFGALPPSVKPLVFGFFFPTEVAMEMEITDDQYFDRQIPLVRPSVKILLTNCMSYTDRMHLLVKLFNGVVIGLIKI